MLGTYMYDCDNFCTYCIVPYVRGRERSREPQAVLNEAEDIIANGYKDITLLGRMLTRTEKTMFPI